MKKTILTILCLFVVIPAFASTQKKGCIVSWGRMKTPDQPLTQLTHIAAGVYHNLAIKSDGSIVGWGDNDYGQATTPAGTDFVAVEGGSGNLNNIIAISAGNNHVLALEDMKDDREGRVYAWGRDNHGQLGNGPDSSSKSTPIPVKIDESTDLTDIVYIDAGMWHSLAIDKDGNIWVWGDNYFGQLGLGDEITPRHYAEKMKITMP